MGSGAADALFQRLKRRLSQSTYRAAISDMLAVLRDPVTRVDVPESSSSAMAFGFVEAQLRDGVLVLTSGKTAADPLESLQPALKLLPQARRRHLRPASRPGASLALGNNAALSRFRRSGVSPGASISYPCRQRDADWRGGPRFSFRAASLEPRRARRWARLASIVGSCSWSTTAPKCPCWLLHCKWRAPATSSLSSRLMIVQSPVTEANHYPMPLGEGAVGHIRGNPCMVHADGVHRSGSGLRLRQRRR